MPIGVKVNAELHLSHAFVTGKATNGHAWTALRHSLVTLLSDAFHLLMPKTTAHSRYDLTTSLNTELIKQIVRRHGATNIQIFGSYLHGNQKDDSDVDLLIDLKPGRGLINLMALKLYLKSETRRHIDAMIQRALPCEKVDLICKASITFNTTI